MHAPAQRVADAAGPLASALLHVVFAGLLLLAARLQPPPVPPEESVAVEIVTPDEFRAATGRARGPSPAEPLPSPEAQAAPSSRQAPQPTVRPTTMLSERTLADPRSRQARAALAQMRGDERMVQLCDV